ncbi:hypothetical protein HELRODRAFT_123067, partial [Helobdella robusta]|uniref:Amino acid permease/ SLC12A domain-containing protein n=1 Tax=Helobdella robusta TaxID=6412 RepID=T1EGW8_HELRO
GKKLKRTVGLSHGIAVIIGLVVGGGIFITPKKVLGNCNSVGLAIFMWAMAGVLCMIGALAFAEIGVRYPVTGEKYAYLNILCGPYYAFAFMWQYVFLMRPGGNAIKALMCAEYIVKPFYSQSKIPNFVIQLVATLFTVIVTAMNCFSIKGTLRSQNAMICITLLSLVILSVIGVVELIRSNGESLVNPFQDSESDPNKLVEAFTSTIFSYYGWSALNFLMEELKKPKRNLPLAIIISLLMTTTLYVLVNISYIGVLGKDDVINSEAVAM